MLEGLSGATHTQGADFTPTSNSSISGAKLLKDVELDAEKGKKLLDELSCRILKGFCNFVL